MKYLISFSLLLSFCILPLSAQNNFSFRDRLYFGGNFGFVVGSAYTDIEISPHVGYYITSRWSAGIGVTYEYYNNKYYAYNQTAQKFEQMETHIWGDRLFTNYVIVDNVNDWLPLGFNFRIFAHLEDEMMFYEKKMLDFDLHATGRKMLNSVLVGGGLRFPMGRRSSMNLTILWNLNSNMNEIYGNGPIIRIGYNF